MKNDHSSRDLEGFKDSETSLKLDEAFATVKSTDHSGPTDKVEDLPPDTNLLEFDLSLEGEEGNDLSLSDDDDIQSSPESSLDEGFDLGINDEQDLELSEDLNNAPGEVENFGEIDLSGDLIAPSETNEVNEVNEVNEPELSLAESESQLVDLTDLSSEEEDVSLDREFESSSDESLEDLDEELLLLDDANEINEESDQEDNLNLYASESGEDASSYSLSENDTENDNEDQALSINESEYDSESLSDPSSLEDEEQLEPPLALSEDIPSGDNSFSEELPAQDLSDLNLDFNMSPGNTSTDDDLSEDAKVKLKEIDELMDLDASGVNISIAARASVPEEVDISSFDSQDNSSGADLDSHDFSLDEDVNGPEEDVYEMLEQLESDESNQSDQSDESNQINQSNQSDEGELSELSDQRNIEKSTAKKNENLSKELNELSGAYSGEIERLRATISNLRGDREELLSKIEKYEEEKIQQSRQTLSLRAELDEKKIELMIIRKKLNEELSEQQDRLKILEEKKLILEEKNSVLTKKLDEANQKKNIDLKKVKLYGRELEQKLELLKSDAETQIKNRDLKILELKRKIDAMEFDMESISKQEEKSIQSRYELEDKLGHAIKTLRTAISVLEGESEKNPGLNALKKSLDA